MLDGQAKSCSPHRSGNGLVEAKNGAVPEQRRLGNGRIQRVYRCWTTPWGLLQAAPNLKDVLRPGHTEAALRPRAAEHCDTEAALDMQQAKRELFRRIGQKTA